jgi:hypothetical protein
VPVARGGSGMTKEQKAKVGAAVIVALVIVGFAAPLFL